MNEKGIKRLCKRLYGLESVTPAVFTTTQLLQQNGNNRRLQSDQIKCLQSNIYPLLRRDRFTNFTHRVHKPSRQSAFVSFRDSSVPRKVAGIPAFRRVGEETLKLSLH